MPSTTTMMMTSPAASSKKSVDAPPVVTPRSSTPPSAASAANKGSRHPPKSGASTTNGSNNNNKPPPIRPGNVQAELEALRQRGLATLLNKHFTTEIHKIAQEKAAADAALLDLEQRKAATSEFQASGDGAGISPMEELFLRVNKWRKECRNKERETLLLYQRYVAKFGSSGVPIQVPGVGLAGAGAAIKSPNVMLVPSDDRVGGGGGGTGNKSPSDSSNGSTPTLWGAAPPPSETPPAGKRTVPSPTKVQVHSMAAAIEQNLEDYVREGALELPSMELLGKESNFSRAAKDQEAEFRNYYRRLLESKGIDAKANDEFLHPKQELNYPTPFLKYAKNSPVGIDETEFGSGDDDDDDDDDDYSGEGQDGLGPLYIHHTEDDDSVVSGLTFNSALTREILDDCERTVVTFLREEKDAIRKMMQEEDGDALTAKSALSQVGSACKEAAAQAENMVQQMQEILNKFKDDDATTVVGTVTKEARKFETNNPSENWMVYYDEYYQREYYHELNTNRTQWEPPAVDDTSVSGHVSVASRSTPLLSSQEVMPEVHHSAPQMMSSASTRIELYRRKRRRQRKRRMAFAAALLVVLGVFSYRHYRGASSLEAAAAQSSKPVFVALAVPMLMWSHVETNLQSLSGLITSKAQTDLAEAQRREAEALRIKAEMERHEKARAELLAQEEERKKQLKLESERKEREEAEQKAREELVRKAKEEAAKAQQLLEHLKREQAAREALDYRVGGRVPMAYFVEDIPLMVKVGPS
jgi:hypothetical protein